MTLTWESGELSIAADIAYPQWRIAALPPGTKPSLDQKTLPVLSEFLFALHLNHNKSIFIDVFQSAQPRFPEIFWLLPAVPTTNWGEVPSYFPPNPLSFTRSAKTRDGDSEPWQEIEG